MDNRLKKLISVAIIITGLAFWTCHYDKEPQAIYVGISKYMDNEHYESYKSWLQDIDSTIKLVDLYHIPLDSALLLLEKCSGLLLSGGADVHPAYYGQPQDTFLCEIDHYRDTLEMAIIAHANKLNLPVFGICRGLQVLNVYYGGTLYPDIPERMDTSVMHRAEDRSFDLTHNVTIVKNTMLHKLTNIDKHEVNSNHHQGIDKLAKNLKATAFSDDGLIEAIELKDPGSAPFLMAVQWHPERLEKGHIMSEPLANKFVKAIHAFIKSKEQ